MADVRLETRRCSTARRAAATAVAATALWALTALAAVQAFAGSFEVRCTVSHRAADDPIVLPNQFGASHMHDFYGGRRADADATWAHMVGGRSSCSDRLDTAGYWHPSLYAGATALRGELVAYYSRGGKPTVRPFPRDLRVVAGNPHATAAPPRRVAYWSCVGRGLGARSRSLPTCDRGERLSASIVFPDCWQGRDLDSADHASHMRYSHRRRCPSSHPVPLPRLTMRITWQGRPRPAAVALSSGAPHTIHADFWNAWHQRRLRRLTNQCLNTELRCGTVQHRPRPLSR